MKVRTDFVTNSSSSSFIVAFKEAPKSAEEVRKVLFGENEHIASPYNNKEVYTTQQIAETVYSDILDQNPATIEKIAEVVGNGWYDGRPDFDNAKYNGLNNKKDWELYGKDCDEKALEIAKIFQDKNQHSVIYTFVYEDGTRYGSMMEHGEIFEELPHMQISMH